MYAAIDDSYEFSFITQASFGEITSEISMYLFSWALIEIRQERSSYDRTSQDGTQWKLFITHIPQPIYNKATIQDSSVTNQAQSSQQR